MSPFVRCGTVEVAARVLPLLASAGLSQFRDFMDYSGGAHICHKRGRSVFRLQVGDRAFYLKRNRFHWVEFWKRVSRLKWPPRGALVEWKNILAVQEAGIPTVSPVAMGECVKFGIDMASFTLTEELYQTVPLDAVFQRELGGSLDDAGRQKKRRLTLQLAATARKLHGSGMYHQDLYLSHFYLGPGETLYLIDLQRVGRRSRVPTRYRVKDLGQLNYSADFTGGISRADRMRFFLAYLGKKRLEPADKKLARKVLAKTRRIARHDVKLAVRRRRRGEKP
ncbi:MAG TPA: lipopolysaccharide kinase InaA family protein [Desulfuromonadales bacterium]|nr:lipopolysaccharide kinase InaA family protein [Desulfuromonadales bacterium]